MGLLPSRLRAVWCWGVACAFDPCGVIGRGMRRVWGKDGVRLLGS
jgi:hypothetical protein